MFLRACSNGEVCSQMIDMQNLQVARAAGFQNPAATISDSRKTKHIGYKAVSLGPLIKKFCINVPEEASGKKLRSTTTLMPESTVYDMLLKVAHEPAPLELCKFCIASIRLACTSGVEQAYHSTVDRDVEQAGNFGSLRRADSPL